MSVVLVLLTVACTTYHIAYLKIYCLVLVSLSRSRYVFFLGPSHY